MIYQDLVNAGFKIVEGLEVPQPPYPEWSIVDVEVILDHVLAEMWKIAPQIATDSNVSVEDIEKVILAVAEEGSTKNPPYPPRE